MLLRSTIQSGESAWNVGSGKRFDVVLPIKLLMNSVQLYPAWWQLAVFASLYFTRKSSKMVDRCQNGASYTFLKKNCLKMLQQRTTQGMNTYIPTNWWIVRVKGIGGSSETLEWIDFYTYCDKSDLNSDSIFSQNFITCHSLVTDFVATFSNRLKRALLRRRVDPNLNPV